MIFSMMMPMLLLMLMFSGCMAVAPESIAGEKERGTIATLLVTPLRRSELAIGKISALSIIALLSGLCSFVGVLLALPKLMGDGVEGMEINANIYQVTDYAWILGVILATILLFVSVISVISALASSVKEAAGYVSPLMILVTIVGVSGMFGSGSTPMWAYFVPVYNSVQCISGVFSLSYEPIHILITMLVNCAAAGVFAFLLTKLFNSERVMFKK
jgi:sodium transport system permease protein